VYKLADAFRAARTEVIEVGPDAIGRSQLGHFGAFRKHAEPLWQTWRQWLLEEPAPVSAAA
jgi:predicted alpha/beta hydrolase